MTVVISENETLSLNLKQIPQHVAIIMDGNRRWAKSRGLADILGHWQGAEVLSEIVAKAVALGVKVLTVYAFSTENWKRNPHEIEALMSLFEVFLFSQKCQMEQEGIRLGTIGDLSIFPQPLKRVLDDVKQATSHGNKLDLVIAFNYGSRDDIRRAIISIVEDCLNKKIDKSEITETLISRYLDTAPWGDPNLLIRTSGETRLSNFLLWQISYTEVYITDILWPDFSEHDFIKAIAVYQKRRRRVGC